MHQILELLCDKKLFPSPEIPGAAASKLRIDELTERLSKDLTPEQWNDLQDVLIETGYLSELEARASFERGFSLCAQLHALLGEYAAAPPLQKQEETE